MIPAPTTAHRLLLTLLALHCLATVWMGWNASGAPATQPATIEVSASMG